MKNLLAEKKITAGQFFLVAWLVFSIIYVALSLWQTGLMASYRLGEQNGARSVITQTIAQAQKGCETFSIFNESARVDLVNVACLQAQDGEAAPAE